MLFVAGPVYGNDYFVAPDGHDNNDGSFDNPFKTIGKAEKEVRAGDTIYLRGGSYIITDTIRLNKNGTNGNRITLRAYQNEVPDLDFGGTDDGLEDGILVNGDYWHIRGLTIHHAGHNGLKVNGSYNILEQMVTHSNGDTGLHLATGASYNMVLNCDSYFNYDPEEHGQDADGFGAKGRNDDSAFLGPGNVFSNCRAWNNSDDGFDFWHAGHGVTVENCWAWCNGDNIWDDTLFEGNGNGFKLGHGYGAHILIRCVAYDHPHHGIDVNGNQTGVTIYNCTCVGNRGKGFYFDEHSDTHILRNNLSHLNGVKMYGEIDDENNSWNLFDDVGDTDFRNLDPNGIDGPRESDGSLPGLSFLRLSPTSPLIDAGMDLGLPFEGDAPDLGAFEYLEGDCEGDGDIDFLDVQWLFSHWLDTDCDDCQRKDLDGNHRIDLYDFAKLADNWRK